MSSPVQIDVGIAATAGRVSNPARGKRVLLAEPRGYCAGVDRAVETVEKALERHGAPVYVRKEIVHNRHVVETLTDRGAVFVEETDEVPEGALLVFRRTACRRLSMYPPQSAIFGRSTRPVPW